MKLREEEFYEQYHQHGGTTIIPTEIFNELYDDATEEIERLNKKRETDIKYNKYLQKELAEAHSIIKEVREYLTDEGVCILNKGMKENERLVWTWENYYDLLEILDKENI